MVVCSCWQPHLLTPSFSVASRAFSDPSLNLDKPTAAIHGVNSSTLCVSNRSWKLPPHSQFPGCLRKRDPLQKYNLPHQGPIPRHQSLKQSKVRSLIAPGVKSERYTAPIISVVIPVFNEVESIGQLLGRVASVLQRRGYTYEILCVDDGSTDGEFAELLRNSVCSEAFIEALTIGACKMVPRNQGESAAMSVGPVSELTVCKFAR